MSRYIFTTLSLISAILLAGTIVLWPWSFSIDPRVSCLSLGDDFHVAVRDGRVSFFNVKEYGPYHGSIISLGDGSEFAVAQRDDTAVVRAVYPFTLKKLTRPSRTATWKSSPKDKQLTRGSIEKLHGRRRINRPGEWPRSATAL